MPRKGKCFSTCRKRPKPECDPPECYYTNGQKYRYCRLAFTRKMDADCKPVLRKPLTHRSDSPKYEEYNTPKQTPSKTLSQTNHSVLERPDKDAIAEFRKKYVKTAATRKIGQFLRKTDPRVRARFLNTVCSDSGVCIAFGTNAAAIRKHFDHFNNFDMLSAPAKQIGAVSSNGFVKELTYKNRGYVANAVLKSSTNQYSDNLLYEALVGFFLNRIGTRFPSFLETYGLYRYNLDGLAYNECKTVKSTDPAVLKTGLKRIATKSDDIDNASISQACLVPPSMSVLIQHLKGAKTLREKCASIGFVKNDLLYIFLQVYATLSQLSRVFTHYDLHYENVLVYEPVVGSHIEYHYHYGPDTDKIVFKSPYIAKIIDYGRCYYKDAADKSSTGNSPDFKKLLCKVCKPGCGKDAGFRWLDFHKARLKALYQISSQVNNPSHDLRLLSMFVGSTRLGLDGKLVDLLRKVVYGKGVSRGKEPYGTEPNFVSGLPNRINNVEDAFKALRGLIQDPGQKAKNDVDYYRSTKLGELHIYDDGRPMRYVPS